MVALLAFAIGVVVGNALRKREEPVSLVLERPINEPPFFERRPSCKQTALSA